jgi:hypothetical protein
LDFNNAYLLLAPILGSNTSKGIGQYGDPSLLLQLYGQIMQVPSGSRASLLNFILTNGIVVGCDQNNYFVFSNEQYAQYSEAFGF